MLPHDDSDTSDITDVDITDEELTALALAADPDVALPVDAVPWSSSDADPGGAGRMPELLPDWYMPALAGGVHAGHGWRRRVAIVLIAAFVLINAAGLCSTYGSVVFA